MLFKKTNRKALEDAEKEIEDLRQLRLQEQYNNELILKENTKLKAKIVDLENNVEFLTNNLSTKNKALIEGNKKRALVGVGNQD